MTKPRPIYGTARCITCDKTFIKSWAGAQYCKETCRSDLPPVKKAIARKPKPKAKGCGNCKHFNFPTADDGRGQQYGNCTNKVSAHYRMYRTLSNHCSQHKIMK